MRLEHAVAMAKAAAARITREPTATLDSIEVFELSLVTAPAAPLPGRSGNILILKSTNGVSRSIRILKATEEEQFILGAALTPDVVDAQGDTYSAETIRRAAHDYLVRSRSVGLQHKARIDDKARIVESYLAPIFMRIGGHDVPEGTWLVGMKITDPELWHRVKRGEIGGYSIGGMAKRTELGVGRDEALYR